MSLREKINKQFNTALRSQNKTRLYHDSSNKYFEYVKVVFAVHANEALKLINDPTENEKKILENFQYKKILDIFTMTNA